MAWEIKSRGELKQFPIISVKKVLVDSTEKWVINEKFWSKVGPEETARFVTVQQVTISNGEETRNEMNVISFNAAEAAKTDDELMERINSAPTDGKAQALAMFFGSRR